MSMKSKRKNCTNPSAQPMNTKAILARMGRCHYRSCPYARSIDLGARSGVTQSLYPGIQNRGASDMIHTTFELGHRPFLGVAHLPLPCPAPLCSGAVNTTDVFHRHTKHG